MEHKPIVALTQQPIKVHWQLCNDAALTREVVRQTKRIPRQI